MILVDKEIVAEELAGNITISNFDIAKVNPNSYDVTLSNKLVVYKKQKCYDLKEEWETSEFKIPEDGFLLLPGQLYLGMTNEIIGSKKFVPILEGRSSIGRSGIFIHVTAGFGDIGFINNWTLEITSLLPVLIYPNMRIGQIYFMEANEPILKYGQKNNSKYFQVEGSPVKTKIFEEAKEW